MGSATRGSQMIERGVEHALGETRFINGTRQQQGADHRGNRDECALMGRRLAPVRQLPGHEVDHFLDVSSGDSTDLRRLA